MQKIEPRHGCRYHGGCCCRTDNRLRLENKTKAGYGKGRKIKHMSAVSVTESDTYSREVNLRIVSTSDAPYVMDKR